MSKTRVALSFSLRGPIPIQVFTNLWFFHNYTWTKGPFEGLVIEELSFIAILPKWWKWKLFCSLRTATLEPQLVLQWWISSSPRSWSFSNPAKFVFILITFWLSSLRHLFDVKCPQFDFDHHYHYLLSVLIFSSTPGRINNWGEA